MVSQVPRGTGKELHKGPDSGSMQILSGRSPDDSESVLLLVHAFHSDAAVYGNG